MFREKRIKRLFLDIDGVLVDDFEETESHVWELLSEVSKKGIEISLITERPAALCRHIVKKIQSRGPHIFLKGAQVSWKNEEILWSYEIQEEVVDGIVNLIKRKELDAIVSSNSSIYATDSTNSPLLKRFPELTIESLKDFKGACNSILIKQLDSESLSLINDLLSNEERIQISKEREDGHRVEVVPACALKEYAAEALLTNLSESLSSSVFVGDSMVDVELHKKVGYPYALANSIECLRDHAIFVAREGFSKGLAETLNYMMCNM